MLPLSGGGVTVDVDGRRVRPRRAASRCSRGSPTGPTLPIGAEAARCRAPRAASSRSRQPARPRRLEPVAVAAEDVPVEIRGAGPATRQVTNFLIPGRVRRRRQAHLLRAPDTGRELVVRTRRTSTTPPRAARSTTRRSTTSGSAGPALDRVRAGGVRRPPDLHARRLDRRDGDGAGRRRVPRPARLPRPLRRRSGLPDVLPERDGGPGARARRSPSSTTRRTTGSGTHGRRMATDPRCPHDEREGTDMDTVRLTTAQAIVRFLVAQRTVVDGDEAPLFPGVFAIFGHGNVTGLGNALDEARAELPVSGARTSRAWRWQRSRSPRRRAGGRSWSRRRRSARARRTWSRPRAPRWRTGCRCCCSSGDTFQSRVPDPVLQQVEHFGAPSTTVNDAFRAVTRYWDRIVPPEQVAQSLPLAVETMLDPADCGPAFIGLPQDVQVEAFDYPVRLFEPRVHELPRQRPDRRELAVAAAALRGGRAPAPRSRAAASTTRSRRTSSARSSSATACRSSRRWRGRRASPPTTRCWVGPGRRHRLRPREPARRGRRRRARGRHPPAGLHHRLVDGVRRGHAHRRAQCRPVRRRRSTCRSARRRRPRVSCRADARRSDGWRADRQWAARAQDEATAFRAFVAERTARADARRAADLRAGRRRRSTASRAPTTSR